MCVRVYYNIDINVLKRKYNCEKILNNEKFKRGMINKKNYMPIIYETAENGKENQAPQKIKLIQVCLWGLQPFNYGKFDKEVLLINARVESLQWKKSFKLLINKNRCAIVVNGYFEWMDIKGSSKKTPYFLFFGNDENSSEEVTDGKVETKSEELTVEKTEEKSEEKVIPRIKEEGVTTSIRVKKEIELNENNKGEIKKEEKEKEEVKEEEESMITDRGALKRKIEGEEKSEKKKIKTELSNEADREENDEEEKSHVIIAGLYSISNKDKNDCRYTIITTASENSALKDMHDRCPLLLSEKTLNLWLDVEKKYEDIIESVKQEHRVVSNNLKFREVKNWTDYATK
ncbi:conserved protein, unknown function [Plasmodium knowlesi strain H]|uniref:SRAP domain-containing protein n=3 Tax=Plasmodium knowlesi TaxID=5850 RepID=A0A5E7X5C3_PLAKH|nr:SRAP domain-containing protein, putative [Plasmodium knowlesi strain H]OTN66852.1 Uncharacterized protein PKNOH_S08473500 [Plasmodium knowlesi]CAA9990060.1 SRAP domain-containing protein, putative [Plasmodium knowlesi strain H]SBO25719.1 conserved protein, unknown function [Plasmodium knowlesi strain H]SBO28532.1 conserved protein, unknown function [Plasmodium knowlesi strain H]VVS79534.1 SRAP domain-containing protein, putative [Plasmodium knowlesi strain H]